MALVEPSVLANSIMSKLYDVLTSGDDTIPQSEDNFFSWCTPGIPISEEDLRFLSQGLTGVVRKTALDEMRTNTSDSSTNSDQQTADSGRNQLELTPALLDQLRAQDAGQLYLQAENFARLVDFVPDLANVTNDQFARLSVMNNEGALSERYEYILRMSQVMKTELPEEVNKKIEKFRELLSVKKIKRNLIDDTETVVTEPSQLVQTYNEKLAAFENAALEYNSHRIDALAADDPRAVHYWSINASILRNKVKAAMTDWVSNGYKNDYEQIAAFIDQVMQRDMSLLKQQYREDLEKAKLTGLTSGSDFYYTSLVPGNFVQASGWTEFQFKTSDFNQHQNSSYSFSRLASRGGGGVFGFFGGGASSSASGNSQSHVQFDSDHFSLSFKIAQVPIVRPWFKTSFLMSKTWRFDQNNPDSRGDVVSDGGSPAQGLIPAYPTAIIFIKDLSLRLTKSNGFQDFLSSYEQRSTSGGGYIWFGPLHLGGSHAYRSSRGQQSSSYHYDSNTQTMSVPGLQVIGYKCHIVPKSPNPSTEITNWV
jgi:hypothetical protein